MRKIIKLALILAVICAISAGLLAYVYLFTAPKIDLNVKAAFEISLRQVLPAAEKFNPTKDKGIHAGLKGQEKIGVAISVAPRGYAGQLEMLVGVNQDGKIEGLKVFRQKETPGLGSKVTKNSFLNQFIGKSLKDKLEPKQDIDAITGATITSRAACKGVREALEKAAKP